jgi:hypothetical protein
MDDSDANRQPPLSEPIRTATSAGRDGDPDVDQASDQGPSEQIELGRQGPASPASPQFSEAGAVGNEDPDVLQDEGTSGDSKPEPRHSSQMSSMSETKNSSKKVLRGFSMSRPVSQYVP